MMLIDRSDFVKLRKSRKLFLTLLRIPTQYIEHIVIDTYSDFSRRRSNC